MNSHPHLTTPTPGSMSFSLQVTLAAACCLILANLHYAQPILGEMAASLGISADAGGFIVTVTQIGYCVGVLFMVPLGDLVDNRRLITSMVLGACIALLGATASTSVGLFLAAMFFVGFFSAAVQMIVPLAVGLAASHERGRVVGLVMSGAIAGIIISRPVASLVTNLAEWRTMYGIASVFMLVLAGILYVRLPRTKPSAHGLGYVATLSSMRSLMFTVPALLPRLLTVALVFSGFTMFWATAPLVLQSRLGLSHSEIALFSLVGLAAPLGVVAAGRLADRGFSAATRTVGISMAVAAFLLTPVFGTSVVTFALAAFLLDPGVNMTNVLVQQSVLAEIPEARSRLNAVCIACTFTGGAIGSTLGPWLATHYGWNAAAAVGVVFALLAMAFHLITVRRKQGQAQSSCRIGHTV